MLKALRIWIWKRRARKHYARALDAADRLSCGFGLSKVVSSEVAHHAAMFNVCMDALAELDPSTPSTRL